MIIYAIDGVRVCSRPMKRRRICGRKPGHAGKHISVEAMRVVKGRTRRCSGCRVIKPRSEFNKFFRDPDGIQRYCRTCNASYRAQWVRGPGICGFKGCSLPRMEFTNPSSDTHDHWCLGHGLLMQIRTRLAANVTAYGVLIGKPDLTVEEAREMVMANGNTP